MKPSPAIFLPDIRLDDVTQTGATMVLTPIGEEPRAYLLSAEACRLLVDVLSVPARGAQKPDRCADPPGGMCTTEARDVATDPRVGDRVSGVPVGMSYEVAGEDMDGLVVNVRSDGVFVGAAQMAWQNWRATCRTPGATIERAGG